MTLVRNGRTGELSQETDRDPQGFTLLVDHCAQSLTLEDLPPDWDDAILTAALQIHSVEARHAARVRQFLDMKSWDAVFDEPMTKEMVLEAATPFLAAA